MAADGPAQRLLRRLNLLAHWLLTGRRPGELDAPTYFDDEGVTQPVKGKRQYRGTLNMKLMAYVHALVYHRLANHSWIDRHARARAIGAYRLQQLQEGGQWNGHMGGEQASPGIHGSMHASAAAVLYLAAVLWTDREALDAATWWWRAYLKLALECHTTTGEVVLPGTNWRTARSAQPLWTAVWRERENMRQWQDLAKSAYMVRAGTDAFRELAEMEVSGRLLPHDPRLARKLRRGPAGIAQDHTLTPLWVGLVMRERGLPSLLDLTPLECMPALHHPMTIERTADGYVARLERREDSVRQMTARWRSWVCHTVRVTGSEWTSERGWLPAGPAKEA